MFERVLDSGLWSPACMLGWECEGVEMHAVLGSSCIIPVAVADVIRSCHLSLFASVHCVCHD